MIGVLLRVLAVWLGTAVVAGLVIGRAFRAVRAYDEAAHER